MNIEYFKKAYRTLEYFIIILAWNTV